MTLHAVEIQRALKEKRISQNTLKHNILYNTLTRSHNLPSSLPEIHRLQETENQAQSLSRLVILLSFNLHICT